MNFTKTIATAVAASFLAAAPAAMAETGKSPAASKQAKRGAGKKRGHGKWKKRDHGKRMMKTLEKIGVDKKRRDAIEKDLKALKTQGKALRQKARAARKEIRALVKANSKDENAYRRALAKMEAVHNQKFQMMQKMKAVFKRHLKPSEQAKLMAKKRGKWGRKGRRGHRRSK